MKKLEISLRELEERWPLVSYKIGENWDFESKHFNEGDLDKWELELQLEEELICISDINSKDKEKEQNEIDKYILERFEKDLPHHEYLLRGKKLKYKHEIEMKYKYRKKLNNLRDLRIRDLKTLKEIRGGDFKSKSMRQCFEFLVNQRERYKDTIYINDEINLMFFYKNHMDDVIRFSNRYLIDKFKISEYEQTCMKFIISKDEKRKRNNEYNKLKFKKQRRNKYGLTTRQQAKKDNEEKILKLINEGLNKTQISDKLNLNKSSMSTTYKHLFK